MSRWKTKMAVDFDRRAADTYRANFPDVDVRCGTVANHLDVLPLCDVLLGGPPCQPFSTAGNGRGKDDNRDAWPDFVAAVKKSRPRMFLAENVPGMLRERFQPHVHDLYKQFEDAGYVVDVEVRDAVCYGAPQFRNRVWWWGIREDVIGSGVRHRWPRPSHVWPPPEGGGLFGDDHQLLPAVTLGQALGIGDDFAESKGEGHGYRWSKAMLAKHPPAWPARPAPSVLSKFYKGGAEGLVQVQSHADPPRPVGLPASTLRSGGDGHDGCCVRIIGGGRNAVQKNESGDGRTWESRHPVPGPGEPMTTIRARSPRDGGRCTEQVVNDGLRVRRLTPAECARLQSCPDDMVWPEKITKTAKYKIIGNGWNAAIAAAMSRALAEADPASETCVDLFCGGGVGALGWHQRYWQHRAPKDGEVTP